MLQSILPYLCFHPSCLKISQVPKVWCCPNCQELPEFKNNKSKNIEQNEVVLRAQEKESSCVCMAKPQNGDKLIGKTTTRKLEESTKNRKDCESEDINKFDCQNVNFDEPINLFEPKGLSEVQ